MGRVFLPDHPLVRGLSRLFDFILLNIAFLITCLPVLTIGASFSALYATLFQIRNRNEERILRAFFSAVKNNFKKGAILGTIALIFGLLLAVNYIFLANREQTGFSGVFLVFLVVATILYAIASVYLFALQARFENSIKNTIVNAILMAVRHFPRTVLLVLTAYLPLAATLLLPRAIYIVVPIYLLTGFSLGGFISVRILNPVFAQYTSKHSEVETDANLCE